MTKALWLLIVLNYTAGRPWILMGLMILQTSFIPIQSEAFGRGVQ